MSEYIDEVKELLAAASPGPWHWAGDMKRRGPELSCWKPGYGLTTVMSSRRLGMQGAQPVFNVDDRLTPGVELAVREVHYRDDIASVDHPDARLIARAPEIIAHLIERIEELER